MIEGHQIKRGLYRLGRASTAQLAAFTGQSGGTIEGYLGTRPDLLEGDSNSAASPLWRLSSAGRRIVRDELRDAGRSGKFDRSEEDLSRIHKSLSVLEQDVESLAATSVPPAGFTDRIALRIAATRKAVMRLAETGKEVTEEDYRLGIASARFDLFERRTDPPENPDALREDATWEMETSVAEYLRWWANLWTGDDRRVPTRVDAGPLVLIHGPEPEHEFIRSMVVAATVLNSPVIRISVGDRAACEVSEDLDRLGLLLTEPAGASVRLIFMVDGGGTYAQWLAKRCLAMDAARRDPSQRNSGGTPNASLIPVMQATDRLIRSCGGLPGFVEVFEHRLSAVTKQVAGALLSLETLARRSGDGTRPWLQPDPLIAWIDTDEGREFEHYFEESSISYLGARDLVASMIPLILPLEGATHSFNSASLIEWLDESNFRMFHTHNAEGGDGDLFEHEEFEIDHLEYIPDAEDGILTHDTDDLAEYDAEEIEASVTKAEKMSHGF